MSDKPVKTSGNVSRRSFLKLSAAGAAAGAVGCANVDSTENGAGVHWDGAADIVVVGTGAAGCAAALFAQKAGARVVMLDKSFIFGGTTAKSGGVFWAPNNFVMRERGIADPKEPVMQYMARVSYPTRYNPADRQRFGMTADVHNLHSAFFDNAADTVDQLAEMGLACELEWTFDGKAMPDYNAQLPENLNKAWRTILPTPVEGLKGGASLIYQLRQMIDQRGIAVKLSHQVGDVIRDKTNRVVGVEAINEEGQTVRIRAEKGVIFASGGFTANERMCMDHLRGPIFGGCSASSNEGDFVAIANAQGAKLGNMNSAWWWSVIVEQAIQSRTVARGIGQIPGDSAILVNAYGKRFVNEKIQYHERTQSHFVWDPVKARYPNQIQLMIFDQACRDRFADSPLAKALGGGLIPEPGASASHVLSGNTLTELVDNIESRLEVIAGSTGNYRLEPGFRETLQETVKRYNGFAQTGVDVDFRRGESPIELAFHGDARGNTGPNITLRALSASGPYYCVLIGAGTLDTNGGPKIDNNARILDIYNNPIAGLYGAGNCVASPAGQGYWAGGATIGLALTFGAIAAKHAVSNTSMEAQS